MRFGLLLGQIPRILAAEAGIAVALTVLVPFSAYADDRHALLVGIVDSPNDHQAVKVYADWLTENGHPELGAFFRQQVDLEATTPDNKQHWWRADALRNARNNAVDKLLPNELKSRLAAAGVSVRLRSGMVQAIVDPAAFNKAAEDAIAAIPFLTELQFYRAPDKPALSLRTLRSAMKRLARSPVKEIIYKLSLYGLEAGGDTLAPLSADMKNLRSLDVGHVAPEGIVRLAQSPFASQLTSLEVGGGRPTLRELFSSKAFPSLLHLNLRAPIDGVFPKQNHFPKLVTFGAPIRTVEGYLSLVHSPFFKQLVEIDGRAREPGGLDDFDADRRRMSEAVAKLPLDNLLVVRMDPPFALPVVDRAVATNLKRHECQQIVSVIANLQADGY